jgi:hypothetical protein
MDHVSLHPKSNRTIEMGERAFAIVLENGHSLLQVAGLAPRKRYKRKFVDGRYNQWTGSISMEVVHSLLL